MQEIVQNYKNLRQNIGFLIQKSGYKNVYLAEKLGIPATNFSVKKKRGSWSVDEIEKIVAIIDNEELEDFLMVKLMDEELESPEPSLSVDEFKRRMGW